VARPRRWRRVRGVSRRLCRIDAGVYVPIGFILTALIFRGIAFEFRCKAGHDMRLFWDQAFHWGLAVATLSQGIILGTFVQGITVRGTVFAGMPIDWLTPFSLVTACAYLCGYALLGTTWLVMKTDGELEAWARRVALVSVLFVIVAMMVVSVCVPLLDVGIAKR
jgi:cytochrome bd ubiquinol oxidase subunit II